MVKMIKKIPKWGIVFGAFCILFQSFIYWFGAFLSDLFNVNTNFWKISIIDDNIPFIPIFILIYIFSYLFWFFGHVIVCLTNKKNIINYATGLVISFLIVFIFFVFFPTYMNRVDEGLILYANKNNLFSSLYKIIYLFDGGEKAYNLFPSLHCLLSVYCYLGVRKQPEISNNYKVYTIIMSVLICLSTLFTKQHYIIDVIFGVLVAIICYLIVNKINPGKNYLKNK